MSQPFDGFGDVLENENGIFAESDGRVAYESVRRQYLPTGLRVEVHCAGCGYPRHVDISWPELISIKYDISPSDAFGNHPQLRQHAERWANTSGVQHRGVHHAWYPADLRCRCGETFNRPHITPGECDQHLSEMRRNGWLHPQAEKGIAQHCLGMRQRVMGR